MGSKGSALLLLSTSANVTAASLRRVKHAPKMGFCCVSNATRGRSLPSALPISRVSTSALSLGPRATENALSPSTRATATATTPTTTVAALSMAATAVRVLSRAELSKQLTANSASARIPSTKAKAVNPNARSHSSSAMATATTWATTVAANTMEATAAVPLSKKLTARSANARIRITSRIPTVKENAISPSTRAMATATTRTTTVAANTMEATAAATLSKKAYCKECKCKDPNYKPNTNCKGKCGLAQFKGDGNCDDENNNCGCAFDGGDCCAKSVKGKVVKTTYCKKCECKDPKYKGSCSQTCKLPKYIGDGNCDDQNNNCGCKYDGGDCCGNNVKKTYCKECKCKDPGYKPDKNCKGKCGLAQYKGDGNCDDANNNCGCDFDGGDCCAKTVKGGKVNVAYCKACICKDPKGGAVKGCTAKCTVPQYIGDGNCDDENNNCACGYDKGDCCGPKVNKSYCKECKCKDPKYKK